MELLLNILWIVLALPAVWIWRTNPACTRGPRWFARCRPFLVLGCALVLLFPVVSVSDDLQAVRPEMEESSSFAKGIKQSAGIRSTHSTHPTCSYLSHHAGLALLYPIDQPSTVVLTTSVSLPDASFFSPRNPRAPPARTLLLA